MDSAQILENVDIFMDLKPQQLEQIFKLCKEAIFTRGEVIFHEGTPSTEFYVIMKGEVAVQVNPEMITGPSERHSPGIIAILHPGQSFGEVALVDQGLRSASAICRSTTCTTLVIQREEFMELLKRDPKMGFKVMLNLATDLCTKIRLSNLNLREGLLYLPRQQY